MQLTTCPECGEVAEVQWRAVLDSTDGPVEHAKVLCVRRHWFLLTVEALAAASARPRRAPTSTAEARRSPGR